MRTMFESMVWPIANKTMWWRRLHKATANVRYKLHGDTARYQWPLIDDSLTRNSIIYSFGVGQDASFETSIVDDLDCRIHTFDPTPKSIQWSRERNFGPRFSFHAFGISDVDGEERFFSPSDPNDISYTVQPSENGEADAIVAKVYRLASIMRMLGHDEIDLLKMDIEGFEHKVINDIASTAIRPSQLLLEFHHGFFGFDEESTSRLVETVEAMGYEIFWVSDRGLEYGFVHDTFVR
jgi:FkbM family methyltransferase